MSKIVFDGKIIIQPWNIYYQCRSVSFINEKWHKTYKGELWKKCSMNK